MRSLIIFSVVCLQLGWSYGVPAGVGAYAYQDTTGNRYGGTYGLDDAQIFGKGHYGHGASGVNLDYGNNWGNFVPFAQNFQPYDDFFPEYFSNLQNLLQEAFNKNLENQRLAYNAAKKAFDLTSNQAGYIPHSPDRFGNFGGFGDYFMNSGGNSAFAAGAAGPGFTHQIAALNPENPENLNVNVMNRFKDTTNPNGFYSVSSSSYSSSSNVNGKELQHKGAETIVNNNGEITKYKVQS